MQSHLVGSYRSFPCVTPIYMEAVLEQFRKEGYPVNEEDKARLSPLIHEHINTQGRHSFVMPEAVVKGELRPLRNPADDPD
jgi:Tn3 transposase DDE domain-containing protein